MRALPVAEHKQPASLGSVFAMFCKQQLGSKGKLYFQTLDLATAVTTSAREESRARTFTHQKTNRTLSVGSDKGQHQGTNVMLMQHGTCPKSRANPVMPTSNLEIKMDVVCFTKAIFSLKLHTFFWAASEGKKKRKSKQKRPKKELITSRDFSGFNTLS